MALACHDPTADRRGSRYRVGMGRLGPRKGGGAKFPLHSARSLGWCWEVSGWWFQTLCLFVLPYVVKSWYDDLTSHFFQLDGSQTRYGLEHCLYFQALRTFCQVYVFISFLAVFQLMFVLEGTRFADSDLCSRLATLTMGNVDENTGMSAGTLHFRLSSGLGSSMSFLAAAIFHPTLMVPYIDLLVNVVKKSGKPNRKPFPKLPGPWVDTPSPNDKSIGFATSLFWEVPIRQLCGKLVLVTLVTSQ